MRAMVAEAMPAGVRPRAKGPAAPVGLNDLQAALVAFSHILEKETREPAAIRARRADRLYRSPKDAAVARERVQNFLAK
jgi:hypothetical protein